MQGRCVGPSSDRENFVLWVKELSAIFKPKGLLLSAAVSASTTIIDQAYDLHKLGKYLDFINVMSYDFHGSWEKTTGHHSSLYFATVKLLHLIVSSFLLLTFPYITFC